MLTPAQMEQVLERIDRRLTAIEQILPTLATKRDLKQDLEPYATKKDLEQYATRKDLERFATKEDLERFATKEDLERFATKEDLERFATKEDLEGVATREDLQAATTRGDALLEAARDEMRVVAEGVTSLFSKYDEVAGTLAKLIQRLERKGMI